MLKSFCQDEKFRYQNIALQTLSDKEVSISEKTRLLSELGVTLHGCHGNHMVLKYSLPSYLSLTLSSINLVLGEISWA